MEILHAPVDAGDFSPITIVSEELLPKLTLEEVKTWTARIGYLYSITIIQTGIII